MNKNEIEAAKKFGLMVHLKHREEIMERKTYVVTGATGNIGSVLSSARLSHWPTTEAPLPAPAKAMDKATRIKEQRRAR